MIETIKTKAHKSIIDNSWVRDVIIPIALILLAALILWGVKRTSIIPDMFKPYILASGVLVIAAAILEVITILTKIVDFLAANIPKNLKKLL